MSEFKVGDVVERIKDQYAGMKVGDVGTIEEVTDRGSLIITEFKGHGSPNTKHDAESFKLFNNTAPPVAKEEPNIWVCYECGLPCHLVTESTYLPNYCPYTKSTEVNWRKKND